jgi:gluconolactonase
MAATVLFDDPSFEKLIDANAKLVLLGEGYQAAEGPVWNRRDQTLLFSDIAGDQRWKWTAKGGMELVAEPTFKGNGMAYDLDGGLLCCEQSTSCLVRLYADGRREIVASHENGVYLNSPNDVIVRKDGSIYFTDPDYGRWNDWIGVKRSFVRDYKGVYRVPPGGGPVELVVAKDDFIQPNGLTFSPDESIIYINDSERNDISAFDVHADGKLGERRLFAPDLGKADVDGLPGKVDGMECDAKGNVWVTGPGGVVVFNPAGKRIGRIRTAGRCLSLAFGGPNLTTLFLTCINSFHSIETKVKSAPLHDPV